MKQRKLLLTTMLVVFVAVLAVGCGGPKLSELGGTVTDQAGQPIAQAQVSLDAATVSTGSDGTFSFKEVEQGSYTLAVEAPGKVAYSSAVAIGDKPSTVSVALENVPLPPECGPREGDPAMTLVYCEPLIKGDTLENFGWQAGSGKWTIVEAGGKQWIEGTSDGGERYAYVSIPEMANADKIVVEYTATYTSPGNTWALQFPADNAEQAHGSAFMVLSAWDGIYVRRYHDNAAVIPSTVIAPPKLVTGEVVTLRITYDHEAKTIDMLRNGQRPLEFPIKVDDDYLIKGPDQTLLKLFVNVGGAAGDTTARWTDFRVWVD